MGLVHVPCPQCHAPCQIPEAALGTTVHCPRCAGTFRSGREPPLVAATLAGTVNPDKPSAPAGNGRASAIVAELTRGEEKARPLSLERVPWAWADRVLPGQPKRFLVAVGLIAALTWVIGLTLAPLKQAFLAAHEWQVQPLFLAVHFVCLRLFVTCYTRNFLAAGGHMDLPPGEAVRCVRSLLGPAGGALSLAIALPLCVKDYFLLRSADYAVNAAFDDFTPGPCSAFLFGIWCVEWLLNAYIWVLLAGFSVLTIRTLRRYHFRSAIEVMLHEKHYRPFLMMSAQGASVVLFFGIVNGFYVWYAGGDLSDYIGLGITGVLLLLGFAPPWMQLKAAVEKAVDAETFKLQQRLVDGLRRRGDNPDQAATVEELGQRLDTVLFILRSGYLEKMHRELGRAEGKAVLLKLLIPASSVGFKFLRPWLGI
jgi:hypothetical protein